MARLTNNELQQRLTAALTENEALRAEVAKLKMQLVATASVASEINRQNGPAARKAAMEAARELAVRSGRCIKVIVDNDRPRDEEGLRARAVRDDISHVV